MTVLIYPTRGRILPTKTGEESLKQWVLDAPNSGEKSARALHIKALHTAPGAAWKVASFFWLDVPLRTAGAAVRAGYQPNKSCPLCLEMAAEGRTSRGKTPRVMPAVQRALSPQQDLADQIRKLAELHQEGVLTDEEFAIQKARVLGVVDMTPPSSPAWAPDPTGRHEHRYWDGEHWTEHVADHGVQAVDGVD